MVKPALEPFKLASYALYKLPLDVGVRSYVMYVEGERAKVGEATMDASEVRKLDVTDVR